MKASMKYIKWYTWVGIGLVFFLLTITLGKMTIFVKDVAHTEALSVVVKSEQIDTGIRMETETKKSDSFTSVKQIPFLQMEEIDIPIRDWATDQEKQFYEEMEANETLLNKGIDAHFSMETDIDTLSDDIMQFQLSLTQSVDGEHEHKMKKTFTFDKEAAKILSLEDMLKSGKKYEKGMADVIKEHSEQKLDKKLLNEKLQNLNEIAWSTDGSSFIFYFNPGDVSQKNEKIKIPLMDFYHFIIDDYYDLFINNEMDQQIKEMEAKKEQKKQEALAAKKQIAITFDDGPHSTETERILDALDKYDAKATFFMLSNNVKNNPDIARKVADEGHEVANHSISHANLKAVNKKQAKNEVKESAKVIEDVTGVKPKSFRPPYGNYTDDVMDFAVESNQTIILWSVDTEDWDAKNAKQIQQQAVANARPGSIILMHDIHKTTADAVPKILKQLKQQGYEFVTVSEMQELLGDDEYGPYYGI